MPIEMKPAAWVGQMVFATIQDAQKSELLALLKSACESSLATEVADAILGNADAIVAILTCAPKAKKPRSDRGKNHRKLVAPATPPTP